MKISDYPEVKPDAPLSARYTSSSEDFERKTEIKFDIRPVLGENKP